MSTTRFDVVGIGSALVDILSYCEDTFLQAQKLHKGSMELIDEIRAESLYRALGPATECSGGSVANSLAGLASLGSISAFLGKVRDDQLGAIFRHDMQALGVHYPTLPAESGPATGRCFVFVTPDAQRTMATYLGACTGLTEADMSEDVIRQSKVLYIEGYQWDQENAKEAIRKAMRICKKAKRKVALTLSDTFCVERHRGEFLALVEKEVDILFANEAEIRALYQVESLENAVALARGACETLAITRSEKGCMVLTSKETICVPGESVAEVTDTTGAGDLFASGFLYGYTRGWDALASAQLGNRCAAAIIQQLGARSLKPLDKLVA